MEGRAATVGHLPLHGHRAHARQNGRNMLDRELAIAARRTLGIVTSEVMNELGMTEHQLRTRLTAGVLERRHRHVFAVAGAPQTWRQEALAATLALPGAPLGHEASGRILRLFGFRETPHVTLLTTLERHQRLSGVRVRRTCFLPPEHITSTNGIPHTTRARTCIDLATVVGDARLQRVIEDELVAGRLSWDELEEMFRSLAGRGRPGISRARRVLQRIEGDPPTESELERMYLDLLREAGIPLPTMQVTAPWAERQPGRVDAMFVDVKSIVELDGRKFHIRNDSFESDRLRDQLAVFHKYRTSRFTYKQITGDPDHVIRMSRALSEPA